MPKGAITKVTSAKKNKRVSEITHPLKPINPRETLGFPNPHHFPLDWEQEND
jgi:hypothetical protein